MNKPEKISNPLQHIGKENPFAVPGGYFEGFQTRLNEKLSRQGKTAYTKNIILSWKTWAAAAVIIVASVIAGNLFNNNPANHKIDREIAQLVEEQLYSINEQTIIEVMENASDNTTLPPDVDSDEMIEYLINQNITENEMVN